MGKVENPGLNNGQGMEEEKTKGRIITKGKKRENPGLNSSQGLKKVKNQGLDMLLTRLEKLRILAKGG